MDFLNSLRYHLRYLLTASNWSPPCPKDENIPLLKVVIEDPPEEHVAATLASSIILALRWAFSIGDNIGSASNLDKKEKMFIVLVRMHFVQTKSIKANCYIYIQNCAMVVLPIDINCLLR